MWSASKPSNKFHPDTKLAKRGADYSFDDDEGSGRLHPPPSVEDMASSGNSNIREGGKGRYGGLKLTTQDGGAVAQSRPAYGRRLTVSGLKVSNALSFYKRGVREGVTAGGGAGEMKSSQSMKMSKKMLTCDQLSDLFRRLDRNGNGTLEKYEFMDIVKKLRLVCVRKASSYSYFFTAHVLH